jgi:hypothetical protein
MTLAKELAETNAILRQSAAESAAGRDALKHVDPEDPRWRPPRREPEPLRASELLLAIPDIGDVLREHFKDVPPKFWEMHEDKSRTVTCLCSEQATIPFGGLHHCKCDRIFWNGQTLKAAPPALEDDVQVCDLCCREVRTSQGWFVLVDGMDGFACDGCRGDR